jgi:hypothetical protein
MFVARYSAKPLGHGIAVAGEQLEVPVEIETGGEPAVPAGQHHRRVRVLALERVERLVQVGEELVILRTHLVGVHRHHRHSIPSLDHPAHFRPPPGPAGSMPSLVGAHF